MRWFKARGLLLLGCNYNLIIKIFYSILWKINTHFSHFSRLQLLCCEDFLLSSAFFDCKLNIFVFPAAGGTEQDIWSHYLLMYWTSETFCTNCSSFFFFFPLEKRIDHYEQLQLTATADRKPPAGFSRLNRTRSVSTRFQIHQVPSQPCKPLRLVATVTDCVSKSGWGRAGFSSFPLSFPSLLCPRLLIHHREHTHTAHLQQHLICIKQLKVTFLLRGWSVYSLFVLLGVCVPENVVIDNWELF